MTKRAVNLIRCLLSNRVKFSLSIMFLSLVFILMPAATNILADPPKVPQTGQSTWWDRAQEGGLDEVGVAYGGGDPDDIRITVAKIIRIILGFLGILAVVLILYAGFKWMTSGGNEETIASAKKMLIAGVIGLVIILSAFAVAEFVTEKLYNVSQGRD